MVNQPAHGANDPLAVLRRPRLAGRRLIVALIVLALIVAGVTIGVTNPFKSTTSSGSVKDNSFPTAMTTIERRSLTEQTEVTGTLGYSGSYTVSLPIGTMSTAVSQAEQAVAADEAKLKSDENASTVAKRLEGTSGTSTIRDARATVNSDDQTLIAARTQLSEDQSLGCPIASSLTVTTPISGSSPSSSGNSGSSSSSETGATGGTKGSDVADQPTDQTTSAPVVTTGSASSVTTTSETLSGTVNPEGLSTTYYFEWGSSTSFGEITPATSAGDGFSDVPVTATITGLTPDRIYDFNLVAWNSLGTTTGQTALFESSESSCVAQRTVVTEDENALKDARDALSVDLINNGSTVNQDEATVTADETTLVEDEQALEQAQSQSTNPGSRFTALPSVGQTITRGQSVYSLDDQPVPLFYGTVTPYRALYLGVSTGADVAQLQSNLIALGFGAGISASGHFDKATQQDVEAWQRSLGVPATGVVALGDYVVEPGALLVTTVTAALGSAAAAGSPVLSATGTEPVVSIALDANLAPEVKAGDPVTVTLPDNSVIPGTVSSVGTVATTPTGATGETPTVTVTVTLAKAKLAANLDQASVNVAITTGSVRNVLVVPVDALLSLSGGGYAVEEVSPTGVHYLVAVTLGLFDDAAGLVQVSGSGLAAGQRIVIPSL